MAGNTTNISIRMDRELILITVKETLINSLNVVK